MDFFKYFIRSLQLFENYIPVQNLYTTWEGQVSYYLLSTFFYFSGRYALTWAIKSIIDLKHDETISRLCASISQFAILGFLFYRGALWGIQAFISYCINDMLYSLWKGPKLQKMIYVHHCVGILISCIGLYAIQIFGSDSPHYINCRKCTIFLLCMEMSAPLLSLYWVLKHEPVLSKYKNLIISIVQPFLLFSYIFFRLIVPEYLFFKILKFSWKVFGIQYFFVVFFIFCLQCMQIYWFLKLLK